MRFRPVALLASGMVVASSACSVDATAPSSLAAPERAAASASGARGEWAKRARDVDHHAYASSELYAMTVDPKRANTLRFGPHTLEIPANAICDADSGYGLLAFDQECRTARTPIRIAALVRSSKSGIPRIDLYPEMRFSPEQVVTLRLYVPRLPTTSSIPRILYCATATLELCVDEAELDPTLATQVDAASSTLFRRIRHFSGYFVEW